jgi:hypothetical protein
MKFFSRAFQQFSIGRFNINSMNIVILVVFTLFFCSFFAAADTPSIVT